MSLLTLLRDAMKEFPMSDIVRERLALAVDRLALSEAQIADLQGQKASLESKIEALQSEKANLNAQLDIERLNHGKTQQELKGLKDEYSEEIRIHSGIEFRKGKRTGGVWQPFCPACHTPLDGSAAMILCSIQKCGWSNISAAKKLPRILQELG